MTSPASSSQQQIVLTCSFWSVIFGSWFLDNGSTDSNRIHSFGNYDSRASFPLVKRIRRFCSLTSKIGLEWTYRHIQVTYVHVSRSRSCMNVFWASFSKYYRRQSLWDEWRRVLHCPTNWWAFLSRYIYRRFLLAFKVLYFSLSLSALYLSAISAETFFSSKFLVHCFIRWNRVEP